MTISTRPKWSLGRGNTPVPSGWQATDDLPLENLLVHFLGSR